MAERGLQGEEKAQEKTLKQLIVRTLAFRRGGKKGGGELCRVLGYAI